MVAPTWLLVLLPLTLALAVNNCDYHQYKYRLVVDDCINSSSSPNVYCSLQDALRVLENDTEVIIQNSIWLTQSITIAQKSDLYIHGSDSVDKVALRCLTPHPNLTSVNITIEMVSSFCLGDLSFTECGGIDNSINVDNSSDSFWGAISISYSHNVTIRSINIARSYGGGLYLLNVMGLVVVEDVNFTANSPQNLFHRAHNVRFGGGLYVAVYGNAQGTFYSLSRCQFIANVLMSISNGTAMSDYFRVGRGGGAYFNVYASNLDISIMSSIFMGNWAEHGGGAAIINNNCSSNVSTTIANSSFLANHAVGNFVQFGGGLLVELTSPNTSSNYCKVNNHFLVTAVYFMFNNAWIGGGAILLGSRHHHHHSNNSVVFRNCTFQENSGRSGAALSFQRYMWDNRTYGVLPSVTIDTVVFWGNTRNTSSSTKYGQHSRLQAWVGVGALSSIFFDVTFTGNVSFLHNQKSAIATLDCKIRVMPPGSLEFYGNKGHRGGAVSMQGSSFISLDSGSRVVFKNNIATDKGGAIYMYLRNEESVLTATACPIQSSNASVLYPQLWNASLIFENNTAARNGNAIFFSSLLPCRIAYGVNYSLLPPQKVFDFVGTFVIKSDDVSAAVATAPSTLVPSESHYYIIPGDTYDLAVTARDDLSHSVSSSGCYVKVHDEGVVTLCGSYICYSLSQVEVQGKPDSHILLEIETMETPLLSVTVNLTLLPCPIGFAFSYTLNQCLCHQSPGLVSCQQKDFIVSVKQGMWAGYIGQDPITAQCPNAFCTYSEQISNHQSTFNLPSLKNIRHFENYSTAIEDFICSKRRRGILCGDCTEGYTTYYNSPSLRCGPESQVCNYGWVLYILTSFLPVTVVFMVITVFGINLAAGYLRGFILFSQIIAAIDIEAGGAISDKIVLSEVWKFFYNMFRLRFFYNDSMSYCLIKGGKTMDILVLHYLAPVYALILIIVVILFHKHCAMQCSKLWLLVRYTAVKGSFVASLSTLLILSYASIAQVSLMILHTAYLYNGNGTAIHKRAYYQGSMSYLGMEHFPYAIPAMLCLCTVILFPLVFLLCCPLVNRCLYVSRLDNNKVGDAVSKCYLGGRFKPFYDIFMGCFKENYYCFAGLYFLYYLLLPLFNVTSSCTYVYNFFVTEVILILMLAVHSVTQPYISHHSNVIDALLFVDLILINGISGLVYFGSLYPDMLIVTDFWQYLQFVLIIAPIAVPVGLTFLWCINRPCIKKRMQRKRSATQTSARIMNHFVNQFGSQCRARYGTVEEADDMDQLTVRHKSLSDFIAQEQAHELDN